MINKDYFYELPEDLIANKPEKPRDKSRLLVYESEKNIIKNIYFDYLCNFLQPSDLLIFNKSKVFPARLIGKKQTGGKIEVLLLEKESESWSVLIRGKVSEGDKIFFDLGLMALVLLKEGKEAKIKFNLSSKQFWQIIKKIGKTPIPPYIKNSRLNELDLRREYQTVFADKFGSAAAPTAGLHFSKRQIGELQRQGIGMAYLDLNIGLGTFAPLTDENILNKKLHSEKFQIPHSTIKKIIQTKNNGGKIVAVGTTTVRALESAAETIYQNKNEIKDITDSTEIFIQPGYEFKIVDSLITNFHLPSSSLMMLVAAFLQHKGARDGRKELLKIYQHAIDNKYRFYSFGDAMIIL